MRSPLASAAELTRVAAGVLLIVVAGRFALVAVRAAAAKSEVAPTPSGAPAPPRGPDRASHAASSTSSGAGTGAGPAAGAAIRVTLMVTAGADRSDVIADGATVGKTPYVGDFSCRVGDTVHFRLVPPKGAPLELDRPCAPGTIKVEP